MGSHSREVGVDPLGSTRLHFPSLRKSIAYYFPEDQPPVSLQGTLEEGVEGMGLSLNRSFWPIDGRVLRPPPASNPAIVGCAPRGRRGFPAAWPVVRPLRAAVAGRGSPSAMCGRQTDRSAEIGR